MLILVIDQDAPSRAALRGRVQLAAHQAELRRLEISDLDPVDLRRSDLSGVTGCLVGPASYPQLEAVLADVRSILPSVPIGVVLDNEVYANDAVSLRKQLEVKIMPLGDLAQIAGFLIDCEKHSTHAGGPGSRGVIAVAQLKGGVGGTTVAAALAACYARHGLTTAAVDLDDINPQLTDWGRVGVAQRTVTSEFLRSGEVPPSRLNELLHPVDSYDGKLLMVGQPERYHEGFHFKADVLERAPSAAEFMHSLLKVLSTECDATVLDLGRSWGVASFAVLPLCRQVLLVTDDDGMSVRRTLDNLMRLKRESDDPDEFDLSRWNVVLNAFSGRLVSPKDLATEIQEMDLLPPEASLFTIPFSEKGRQWGAPGQSLYELAEEPIKNAVAKIAASMVPFRHENREASAGLGRRFGAFLGVK